MFILTFDLFPLAGVFFTLAFFSFEHLFYGQQALIPDNIIHCAGIRIILRFLEKIPSFSLIALVFIVQSVRSNNIILGFEARIHFALGLETQGDRGLQGAHDSDR